MTIDEAIAYARDMAKYKKTKYDKCPTRMRYCCEMCFHKPKCNEVAKGYKQLAEWLEELKDYQDKNKMVVRVDVENMDSIKDKIEELSKYAERQYNKAIDDFAEKLKSECKVHYVDCDPYFGGIEDSILYEDDIDEIAEQLKVGGSE